MSKKTQQSNIILVTGPSGAGRSTAINALEDLGFETINNMPLSLLPSLLCGPPNGRQIALGVDIRTRDFSVGAVLDFHEEIKRTEGFDSTILFLDCTTDGLVRRYSETRRRHPLTSEDTPEFAIAQEKKILSTLRQRADVLIDTTKLHPHDLKLEIRNMYGEAKAGYLAITLHSFSYKRGVPRGIDMVYDCRFLNNPYWEKPLRTKNGTNVKVADYVQSDARFSEFFERLVGMCEFLLPAYIDEGKAHFSVGLGCTGGQHRSVCVAEKLGKSLADSGWDVSIRHRELERQ
ncbi:MAG: RNase adapter RapZ [Proteobacteria bacterium]|nr:RNase adapter RapZ [Pseudomonadota bacterium]